MLKKAKLFRMVSVLMICVMIMSGANIFSQAAGNKDSLRNDIAALKEESAKLKNEIKALEADAKKQNELKAALEKNISNLESQIQRCNVEISAMNSKIAKNKAEIKEKTDQMEADKLTFKKRIRAIYMSSTESDVQVLLGAESFSDFLALSQLTASVSARDKALLEKIVEAIKVVDTQMQENNRLLEEQVVIKNDVSAKQSEIKSQQAKIQGIINSLNATVADKNSDVKENTDVIKQKESELKKIINSENPNNGGSNIVFTGSFTWPLPGCSVISSPYGYRWGSLHNGVDLANGRTYGLKIVAMADGVVTASYSSCPHKNNFGDRCGGGWGNYVSLSNGTKDGVRYQSMYAHMSSVAVSTGEYVKEGQLLGYVGSSGSSTGAHLHFGIAQNGTWVDPMRFYNNIK